MTIKQKKHQNREAIIYTDKELKTMKNGELALWIVAAVSAFVNWIVSTISLLSDYDDSLAAIVSVSIICLIAVVLVIRPFLLITLRHAFGVDAPDFLCIIKRRLIGWYCRASYFRTLLNLMQVAAVNIIIFVLYVCREQSASKFDKTGKYLTFSIGMVSLTILLLWMAGDTSAEESGKKDIEVI